MKKSVLFFCLFSGITLHGFSQANNPLLRDTTLWNRDVALSTEDFKGRRSGNAFAFTCTALYLYSKEKNGNLLFYVEAIFLKSKSFMKDSSVYILKHEQLHFDICELQARKLRQKVAQRDFKKVNNIRLEIQGMYNKSAADLEREENKYDKDTEHGLNAAKQKLWNETISNN